MAAYARGEAKEGVGMGGALALSERAGVPAGDVRDRVAALTDRLLAERESPRHEGPRPRWHRFRVGKTVATLATIRALEDAGHAVQPAKAGPDFIDPSHHERVTGRPSRTLDLWLQGEDGLRRNYARGEGDVCVVEGAMGAVRRRRVEHGRGRRDARPSGRARGRRERRHGERRGDRTRLPGVRRPDRPRHRRGRRDRPARARRAPRRRNPRGAPGRPHVLRPNSAERRPRGTRPPPRPTHGRRVARARRRARRGRGGTPTERLVDISREPAGALEPATAVVESTDGDRPRVAVARDDAFRFMYPATIERLRERATVEPFAPIAGDSLPPCDGVYLPGGYPELHAAELAMSPALDEVATTRGRRGLPCSASAAG